MLHKQERLASGRWQQIGQASGRLEPAVPVGQARGAGPGALGHAVAWIAWVADHALAGQVEGLGLDERRAPKRARAC